MRPVQAASLRVIHQHVGYPHVLFFPLSLNSKNNFGWIQRKGGLPSKTQESTTTCQDCITEVWTTIGERSSPIKLRSPSGTNRPSASSRPKLGFQTRVLNFSHRTSTSSFARTSVQKERGLDKFAQVDVERSTRQWSYRIFTVRCCRGRRSAKHGLAEHQCAREKRTRYRLETPALHNALVEP